MTLELLQQMYAHMEWADRRVLALVDRNPAAAAPAMHLLSHLLAAERVWLLRLHGRDSSVQPVWPAMTREHMGELAAACHEGYTRLLAESTPASLAAAVTYTNQFGRTYSTQVRDILIHVAIHGAYHRGQLAAAIRAAGCEPVNTDYITFVREPDGG
jgi:uncharacterized damage-inducible protein DinB